MTALTKRTHRVNSRTENAMDWLAERIEPLWIAYAVCLVMVAVAILYVASNPAVDAGMIAGK